MVYGLATLLATLAVLGFFARQASEQYFTSAQFLAQLLRQVMSRPHVTQILLGSDDLLPLKLIWLRCPVKLVQSVAVVMRVGAVVAPAQFHGQVLVGVGNAFYAEQGRAVLHFQ